MKITDFGDNIFYIEGIIPHWKEFIEGIEANEDNPEVHSVLPKWNDWYDSRPVKKFEGNNILWEQDKDKHTKGKQKLLNWDISLTENNSIWPRKPFDVNTSPAHEIAGPIIDLVYKPYLEALKIWEEKTGNPPLDYVSKNFFVRKYHAGGMIGPHIDKNHHNPMNTMDWTALIYLNDDYEGGEVKFVEKDLVISPTAGSILFFPCTAVHEARPVMNGEKYYIFQVIHSEFGYSTGLGEPYNSMNLLVLKHKGITDHILIDIDYAKLGEDQLPENIGKDNKFPPLMTYE